MKRHKFHAIRTTCSAGHQHPSKKEAKRCGELHLLEKAGAITELMTQVSFDLVVNGMSVGRYVADWGYKQDGKQVIEDVKAGPTKTPVYRLKKKLMLALFNIQIRET